jgi:hypothetical protein
MQAMWKDVFRRAIPDIQQKLVFVTYLTRAISGYHSMLVYLRLAARLVGDTQLVTMTLYKLEHQPTDNLQFVASHAHGLVRYDFISQGITRDADSFRVNCKLSDFNSFF